MSDKIVDLKTYVAAQTPPVGGSPPQLPENELIAMLQIYALLHQALAENMITDSSAGHSVSQAMQKIGQIIKQDYADAQVLYNEMKAEMAEMKTLGTVLLVVGIIGAVLGFAALFMTGLAAVIVL